MVTWDVVGPRNYRTYVFSAPVVFNVLPYLCIFRAGSVQRITVSKYGNTAISTL